MQAAVLMVLNRYTGQDDLPIGSIFTGRTRPEFEPVAGFFVNALVLRTDVSGDPSFAELVRRCNAVVLDATEHQDVPFGLLVNALAPERVAGRNPLFQVSLTLQPASTEAGLTLGDIRAEPLDAADSYARFDLLLNVGDTGGRLDLMAEYSTEMFNADRIERLLDHVIAALSGGLAALGSPVSAIQIMSVAERHQVLRGWNETTVPYPVELVHRLVEATAARAPGAVAVIDHDGTPWTYRQLDEAASQLAHRLRRHGAGPGVSVAICLERGIDMMTALLATLKAGSAYLPLEPDLPPERLAFMLADAAPPVVITHSRHRAAFPAAIALDAEKDALAAEPTTPPDSGVGVDDLAYVMYTSGSTGVPKGVLISHRAIQQHLAWMQDAYQLQPADRVLQKTPYSFDVSVWELFWPLIAGATLVIAAPGGHRDPRYLHELIAREGVTTTHFVPSMLPAFLDGIQDGLDPGALRRLRRVFASGEALPPATAQRFLATWPEVELHNLYGPTEASIDVTAWRCEPDAATVPIGRPVANMRAYVLDGRLRPAPAGVPGQLFLAGPGLAFGYLRQPSLTAGRFLPDPFADQPGQRMYATGDLARWRSDGQLEYLGRTDRQVKLLGQRIELGEIERALTTHPAIRQAAVILREEAYLAAYLVVQPSQSVPNSGELRVHLARHLPANMIPTAFVALAELPLTSNGKLDTVALPDPSPATSQYVAPRTHTERWLAAAWEELLGARPVSITDSFFDLGGNSLHGTRLIARIRESLGIALELRHLYTSEVLEQLAIRLGESGAAPAEGGIVPVARDGALPCTLQQEGLWFLHQLDPGISTYHIAFALRLHGALDVPALERAVRALVTRHEALRTRFTERGGRPFQVIDPPPGACPLPVDQVEPDHVERWVTQEIYEPFDLATGPMFRVRLARLALGEHALVLTVHHIVADGWSAKILADDLSLLYRAEIGTGETVPPPPAVQPADHAAWQRGWLDEAELQRQVETWRQILAGLPTVDFPADRPRPARPTGAGEVLSRRVPDEVAAAIRSYARASRSSPLAVLHAGLLVVLNRYTGQEDLTIGSVFTGRARPEIEPVVGFFANTLVVRTDVGGEPSFAELVSRCHDGVVNAATRQEVPFSVIVDALAPERVPGRNPLFQISLSLQPAQNQAHLALGTLATEPIELTGGYARFDIAIGVIDANDRIDFVVEYSTELFDADRIDRLLDHLVAALGNGLAEPGTLAEDIDIMSASEREQVLHAWNPVSL
jgi:amino acid adenylation domain-containing protein